MIDINKVQIDCVRYEEQVARLSERDVEPDWPYYSLVGHVGELNHLMACYKLGYTRKGVESYSRTLLTLAQITKDILHIGHCNGITAEDIFNKMNTTEATKGDHNGA